MFVSFFNTDFQGTLNRVLAILHLQPCQRSSNSDHMVPQMCFAPAPPSSAKLAATKVLLLLLLLPDFLSPFSSSTVLFFSFWMTRFRDRWVRITCPCSLPRVKATCQIGCKLSLNSTLAFIAEVLPAQTVTPPCSPSTGAHFHKFLEQLLKFLEPFQSEKVEKVGTNLDLWIRPHILTPY